MREVGSFKDSRWLGYARTGAGVGDADAERERKGGGNLSCDLCAGKSFARLIIANLSLLDTISYVWRR